MQQPASDQWVSIRQVVYPDLLISCLLTVGLSLGALFISVEVVRILLGLPVVLFLPGYVFVMTLFPRRAATAPSHLETGALSVVGSLSLLLGVGFLLNYTRWGITPQSVFGAICGLTVLLGGVATIRRPLRSNGVSLLTSRTRPSVANTVDRASRRDLLLGGVISFSLLFGITTALSAYLSPRRGETYTEFSVLAETEDGDLTASDYPTELLAGESHSLVTSITNKEQETTSYQVVVELQDRSQQGDSTVVVDREELSRYNTAVGAGETDRSQVTLTPTMIGSQLRLQFSLYLDDAPAEPSTTSAYRTTHLWVSVADSAETSAS